MYTLEAEDQVYQIYGVLGSESLLRRWSTFYLTSNNEVIHRIIPVSDKFMIDRHGYRISDRRWILGEMSKIACREPALTNT